MGFECNKYVIPKEDLFIPETKSPTTMHPTPNIAVYTVSEVRHRCELPSPIIHPVHESTCKVR